MQFEITFLKYLNLSSICLALRDLHLERFKIDLTLAGATIGGRQSENKSTRERLMQLLALLTTESGITTNFP